MPVHEDCPPFLLAGFLCGCMSLFSYLDKIGSLYTEQRSGMIITIFGIFLYNSANAYRFYIDAG